MCPDQDAQGTLASFEQLDANLTIGQRRRVTTFQQWLGLDGG